MACSGLAFGGFFQGQVTVKEAAGREGRVDLLDVGQGLVQGPPQFPLPVNGYDGHMVGGHGRGYALVEGPVPVLD